MSHLRDESPAPGAGRDSRALELAHSWRARLKASCLWPVLWDKMWMAVGRPLACHTILQSLQLSGPCFAPLHGGAVWNPLFPSRCLTLELGPVGVEPEVRDAMLSGGWPCTQTAPQGWGDEACAPTLFGITSTAVGPAPPLSLSLLRSLLSLIGHSLSLSPSQPQARICLTLVQHSSKTRASPPQVLSCSTLASFMAWAPMPGQCMHRESSWGWRGSRPWGALLQTPDSLNFFIWPPTLSCWDNPGQACPCRASLPP